MSDNRIRVRKTLVIGLGGTGRDAVLNVKRRYLEAYGPNELPTIQFLVFDTTDQKPLAVENGPPISLSPGEFFKMTVPNPQLVAEVNEEVNPWFPRERVQMRSIARGAGQVRAVGRLALFHNAVEVNRRIKAALDRLNGIRPHQDLGMFELAGDAVLVNVVGSLSGGTGSGTFLDVAYVCRHHMRPSRDLLISYLLLPDVFAGRPGTENVEPNAYAAIKELDMLMDRMANETHTLNFGGEAITASATPFDMVYLVNNRNRRGQVFNEVSELTELLGTGIFIASGAGGQEAGDVWDNLQYQLPALASYGGKRPHYASFGVGEIVLDVKRFAQEQHLRHAALAAESLSAPLPIPAGGAGDPEEAMRREVEDFLGELSLNSVDKLRAALDPATVPFRFSIDPTRSPGEWENDLRQKGTHVSEQESRTRTRVEERLKAFRDDAKTRVAARAQTLVGGAGGLSRAVHFFTRVATVLDERHAQAEKKLQGLAAGAPGVREEFEKRMKELQTSQKYLGRVLRRNAVRSAAENAGASVDQETALAVDAVRYTAAGAVITSFRGEVRDVAERLQRLLDRLSKLAADLRSQARVPSAPRQVRPFTIELPCPGHLKAEHPVHADDVLAYMAQRDLDLLAAESRTDDELKEIFTGFAREMRGIADLGDFDIETLFSDRAFLHRHVELLDQVADPMWQYETAYLHGGRGTHTIYIFGVGNADRTNFRSDEVAEALSSSHYCQVTSTNDRQRIYCYKIEAAIPGFALDRMHSYRNRYEHGTGGTFHVDGAWQEGAPDLWPASNGAGHSANGTGARPGNRVPVDKIVSDAGAASTNGANPAAGHANGAAPYGGDAEHGPSSAGDPPDAGAPPHGADASA
jgi:hypothetical protein